MKVLLIGIGQWGQNHIRVLSELRQDLYVVDKDEKRLEKCDVFNISKNKLGTDYKKFLKEVDAVVLVTPTSTHYKLCKEFLEAGKDVFVEKPIAETLNEIKELVEIADKKKRILMVGHIFVHNPATKFAKEYIDSGKLGKVYCAFGSFSGLKDLREDSGTMLNYGVHHASIFNYLFGKSTKVYGFNQHFLREKYEDFTIGVMKHGDVLTYFDCSWLSPGKERTLTIIGSEGSLIIDLLNQKVLVNHGHHTNGKIKQGVVEDVSDAFVKFVEPLNSELKQFVDCVKDRKQPLTDGKHALEVMETLSQFGVLK